MARDLTPAIAWRWLIKKKSHVAVGAISIVAVVGIAVATAAIVCVLSVFNGFQAVLGAKLDTLSSDVEVTIKRGKTIAGADSLAAEIGKMDGVAVAMPVVADNALLIRNGREMPVLLKGVDGDAYRKLTSISNIMLEGDAFETRRDADSGSVRWVYDEDVEDYVEEPAPNEWLAAISIGVGMQMDHPVKGDKMLVFAPRREGRVNLANPVNSFLRDSVEVCGVFQSQQNDYDLNYVITDIELAREMFQYTDEATSIEVGVNKGESGPQVAEQLREKLGEKYVVKDRLEQQEMNFRMIKIEKWVSFLLLVFILVIASFNIVSTLSMLVLDKREQLWTLHSMGLSKRRIGRIFAWESMFVTVIGCGAGMLLGVVLVLLQEKYGLIRLGGDPTQLIVDAYPVVLNWMDLPVVLIPVLLIGGFTAWIASRFAKTRIEAKR